MLRRSQYHDVSTTMYLKPSSLQDSSGFAALRSRHMLLSSSPNIGNIVQEQKTPPTYPQGAWLHRLSHSGYKDHIGSTPRNVSQRNLIQTLLQITRRMSHLSKTLGRFWKRWKREYLLELREFHRSRARGGVPYTLQKGEVVTVYDEGHPRGLWRLGRIEDLIEGSDGRVRGVYVTVMPEMGHINVLRRPIHPLEVRSDLPVPSSELRLLQLHQKTCRVAQSEEPPLKLEIVYWGA